MPSAPPHPGLFTYLTTDPQALGILSWASTIITVLGFVIAIWQIMKVRRVADAARLAAIGMELTVRSRELLAKLGEAHPHFEAARNHVARGEREIAVLCMELSAGFVIEAQEISQRLPDASDDLHLLSVTLSQLSAEISEGDEPLADRSDFVQLRLRMREAATLLQRIMAHSRYTYSLGEG